MGVCSVVRVGSIRQRHIIEEDGKAIEVISKQPCRFSERVQLATSPPIEIVRSATAATRAGFDERACTIEALRFFMQHVINVPRFSTTSAYHVHGLFLHVSGV